LSDTKLRAHAVALLTIIIWSLTFVQTKVLLVYLSPVEILIDRFVLAWVIFWMLAPRRVRTSLREEMLFVLLGASGIFGYYIFENLALRYTTAIHVGLIVTTTPVFTALFLLPGKPFGRLFLLSTIGGFLLVVSGVWIMSRDGLHSMGIGDGLALAGAVSFGLYSVLLGTVNERFDALIVTRKSFFWGIIFLILYALYSGESFHSEAYWHTSVWGNLLFLAVVASGACFVMWRWAVARIGADKASNYIYLVPLINAAAAVWILDETVTVRIVIAGAMMLGGLYVAQRYSV
jgi:drug/metabolite transporter (DMT)-like permease